MTEKNVKDEIKPEPPKLDLKPEPPKPTHPIVEPPEAGTKPVLPTQPTPAEKLEKLDEAKDKKDAKAKEVEKAAILKKVAEILEDHGGAENNVPPSNEYWTLLNRYRSL